MREFVQELFLQRWPGNEDKRWWDSIDRPEDMKTPLSDHLLGIFQEWGKSFIGLSPDFELMFERFEMLGSLADLEQNQQQYG
jgi:hypothetical protein